MIKNFTQSAVKPSRFSFSVIYLQFLLADNKAIAILQRRNGPINHIINNPFRGLLLICNRSSLAHKEWAGVIEGVVVNLVAKGLHIVFNWNLTTACKLLDLLSSVIFPVLNIWVQADTEWAALHS
jgi:hypothetical protein